MLLVAACVTNMITFDAAYTLLQRSRSESHSESPDRTVWMSTKSMRTEVGGLCSVLAEGYHVSRYITISSRRDPVSGRSSLSVHSPGYYWSQTPPSTIPILRTILLGSLSPEWLDDAIREIRLRKGTKNACSSNHDHCRTGFGAST